MKKILFFLLCLLLVACGHNEQREITQFQQKVLEQCDLADDVIVKISEVLQSDNPDSVRFVPLRETGYSFIIFGPGGLFYWTDNQLSINRGVSPSLTNEWSYAQLENAHVLARWELAGRYSILTLIPIKNAYPYENRELHNVFRPPFDVFDEPYDITVDEMDDAFPIHDMAGRTMFSLVRSDEPTTHQRHAHNLVESFSYRHLFFEEDPDEESTVAHSRARLFYTLCLMLIVGYLLYDLYILYRYWRYGLNIQQRVHLILGTLCLGVFVAVFFVSTRYVQKGFSERQNTEILNKTKYIQRALQSIYLTTDSLTDANSASLNVDLLELSFLYKTDIHIYNKRGRYVASSQPLLFSQGIIGTQINPIIYFAKNCNMLLQERIGTMRYACAYTELYNSNYQKLGFIAVPIYVSGDEMAEELDSFMSRLLPIYLIAIIISLISSIWAARKITAPIYTLSEHMSWLSVDHPNQKIDYQRTDELGELVKQYNKMVDVVAESARKLAADEREGAWDTMAHQIAHEVKNPLTAMRLSIQQLIRFYQNGDERFNSYFPQASEGILQQIDSLTRVANSFRYFDSSVPIQLQRLDVASLLMQAVQIYRFNEHKVVIDYIGPNDEPIYATADKQILQVFNNLLLNALQAIGDRKGGHIEACISGLGPQVTINVIDNGAGVPDEIRDKIFEPKFTTKSTGTGIGLAVCRRIVEGSKGRIYFNSVPGKTTFTVELPKG